MSFLAVVALAAAAGLGCCGTASAFVVPPSAALFCEGARYFGGLFRVLPLARRKRSAALQRGAGQGYTVHAARGRRHTDTLTCLALLSDMQGSRTCGRWRCRASVHRCKRTVQRAWQQTYPAGAPLRSELPTSSRTPSFHSPLAT
jgi:hypothetical protein